MKRSEMLLIITNELCVHEDAIMTYSGCKKLAELLLKKIEDAGMLPPTRNADLKSSYGYARINEWKPESKSE